jgi:hypothetical protein
MGRWPARAGSIGCSAARTGATMASSGSSCASGWQRRSSTASRRPTVRGCGDSRSCGSVSQAGKTATRPSPRKRRQPVGDRLGVGRPRGQHQQRRGLLGQQAQHVGPDRRGADEVVGRQLDVPLGAPGAQCGRERSRWRGRDRARRRRRWVRSRGRPRGKAAEGRPGSGRGASDRLGDARVPMSARQCAAPRPPPRACVHHRAPPVAAPETGRRTVAAHAYRHMVTRRRFVCPPVVRGAGARLTSSSPDRPGGVAPPTTGPATCGRDVRGARP